MCNRRAFSVFEEEQAGKKQRSPALSSLNTDKHTAIAHTRSEAPTVSATRERKEEPSCVCNRRAFVLLLVYMKHVAFLSLSLSLAGCFSSLNTDKRTAKQVCVGSLASASALAFVALCCA